MSFTVGELNAKISLDDSDFNRKTDAAGNRFQGLGDRVHKVTGFMGNALKTAAVGGIAAMGAGLIGAAVAGIKYNSSIEQTTIAMGTMLGSTAKAKTLIGEVTKMSAATPFEFPELADATKRLVAYGVAAEDAVPLMTRLGDISSALQVPIGELADLYGKMKVSGKITMEDVNQMAGRGIPIYAALADVLGKGEGEIRGLVETGKVGFPDVEKAFVSLTDEGSMFGGMMEKQSTSFAGLLSTVKDNAMQLFGMVMMPAFKWLTKVALPKAIDLVGKFGEGFKKGGLEGGLASIMDPETAKKIVDTLKTVKDVTLDIFGVIGKVAGVFIRLPGSIQKVIISVGLLAGAMRALNVPIRLPSPGAGKGGAVPVGAGVGTGAASIASSVVKLAGIVGAFVIAAEIIGKLYGDRALKPGKEVPPGETGGAGVYKWSGGVDTTKVAAEAEKAAKIIADTIDKVMAQLGAKATTATGPAFARIREQMTSISTLAAKGFKFGDLKADKTDGQLRSLRDKIQSELGITQRAADRIMASMFKDWRPQPTVMGHLNPAMAAAEARMNQMRANANRQIAFGRVNNTALINAISQTTGMFNSMTGAARTAGDAAINALSHGSYRGHFAGATGAVVTQPTFALIGEAGPEVVAPLNTAIGARALSGFSSGSDSTAPTIVHEHYYIQLPGGSAMVGNAEDVGRQVAPAVGRRHEEAAAARARSR